MGKVHYLCEKAADDGELFGLIYRAATHTLAEFDGSIDCLRLTVMFGGGNMICLANRKGDLYRNYNDAEDRPHNERIYGLKRIVHPSGNNDGINFYDEFLCIQTVYVGNSHWCEVHSGLRNKFMEEFKKALIVSDNFYLSDQD